MEVGHAAKALGFDISEEELDKAFLEMDGMKGDGRVRLPEFENWWNESHSELHDKFTHEIRVGGDLKSINEMGGGSMFG